MTRLINVDDRAHVVLADGVADVERASGGRFNHDIQAVYGQWADFQAWIRDANLHADSSYPEAARIGAPAPRPSQLIGLGLNHRQQVESGGFEEPERPGVFSKFVTSVSGPFADLAIDSDSVFTETEVAVVIGRRAVAVSTADALSYVAGLTVAQDLADAAGIVALKRRDGSAGASYMDIAKSRPGFVPLGPELVTLDEVPSLDDLDITLHVRGEQWQLGSSGDLVFGIPQIIAYLSSNIPLLPGDVILTGSPAWLPAGTGETLRPGDEIVAAVEGLGTQRQRVVRTAVGATV